MKGFVKYKGKGEQVLLPNRRAVNQLARGEPWEKSLNNYAKVTPSGENALDAPDITDMVQVKY
jgi:hypothetical protein